MKRWEKWKNSYTMENGFTMLEMIITVAISAILVGTVVATLGYISSGNARRSAARFNSKLNTAQTETMMMAQPTYLYLFKNNGIKVVLSDSETESLDDLKADSNATEVGGAQVTVTANNGSNQVLEESTMIRIAFNKATGAYEYAKFDGDPDTKFISEIEFSGRENYKVTLVKSTGKHVMSK